MEARLIVVGLRWTEASEEDVDAEDAVAIRSISWLGRPMGLFPKRSGEASRSLRWMSRSVEFIVTIPLLVCN